ncbi:hypothetical protein RN01_16695 [Cupriavidus sp. SHE]|uniref:DUF2523 domain-containing protein n=1 Tax=Cupriavidus TaxID=106589 RepID=UPI0005727201|nr:DUF2523 domain-containing protein [Cupriavidus sp. SHE]KWR81183.1 hypothetical protein RN01_16695 [Cupriavidus sp. SHE]
MWAAAIQLLWGVLLSIIGSMVGKILIALGVGYVQYKGIQFLFDKLVTIIDQQIVMLPPQILQMLSLLGIGTAFNLILSCITIKAALGGVFNGSLVKMIWKGGDSQ